MEQELQLTLLPIAESGAIMVSTIKYGHTYTQRCKNDALKAKNPAVINSRQKSEIFDILFTRHNGRCHWCNTVVTFALNTAKEGTIDHLKTIRMGRKNYYDGGHVLACRKCNGDRNTRETKDKNETWKIRLKFDWTFY
jgi:5-methylcytosine-specific restriction endonuclease McrA